MKIKGIALCVSIFASVAVSPIVNADQSTTANSQRAFHLEEQINFTQKKLDQVKEAVWAYYSANVAWPSSLPQLSSGSDPYYSGTFDTPLGMVTGSPSGGRYVFTLSVGASANEAKISQVKRLAAQMGGDYVTTNNSAVISISAPHGAALVGNMLSRVTDTSGSDLNRMDVDLEMSNFDVDGFKTLLGIDGEVLSTAKAASVDATTGVSNMVIAQNANIDLLSGTTVNGQKGNIDHFKVSGNLSTVNGEADELSTKDLTATALQAVTGNIVSAEIADFRGDRMDFRVGLVTNQLTTNELVVDGQAHAATADIPVVASRSGGQILVDDGLRLAGPVHSANTVVYGDIDQVRTAQAIFKNTVNTQSLTVADRAMLNGFAVSKIANVQGPAVFGNVLNIQGQTTVDGVVNADSLTVAGSFESANLTSNNYVRADGGIYVGGKRITSAGGDILYENGQRLDERYLKRGDTAVNSNRLDGLMLDNFAQLDIANTFAKTQTFNNLTFNGSMKVGGHLIAGSDGTLYERGVALSSLYEDRSTLASQKSNKLAQIDALSNQLLGEIAGVTDYGSRVSSLETLHASNRSRATTALANSNSIATASLNTKNSANTENTQATSLVSNITSEYNRQRIYQTNIVSNSNSDSEEVDVEQEPIITKCNNWELGTSHLGQKNGITINSSGNWLYWEHTLIRYQRGSNYNAYSDWTRIGDYEYKRGTAIHSNMQASYHVCRRNTNN